MKRDEIISKYRKDRNLRGDYQLDEDENYLIDEIVNALKQGQTLPIHDVSISLVRAKKYARHQHFLGTQKKELVEFEDWKQD